MTDFEKTLLEAFKYAEKSRKAAGMAPRDLQDMREPRKNGAGQKWTGPRSYKVTLWLKAHLYADAMMAKSTSTRPDQSLTRYLTTRLEDTIPKVATRPTPRGAVAEDSGAEVVSLRSHRVKKRAKSIDFSKATKNPFAAKAAHARRAR